MPIRPPGRKTRRSSRRPASSSSRLRTPKPSVERAVFEGQRERIALNPFDLVGLCPRAIEHPLREVEARHLATRALCGNREISGPAAGVEYAVARRDDGASRLRPPA